MNMKTTAKQPEIPQNIPPKAKNQAATSSILQKYKNKTAQLQSAEEEELLQGKFETVQKLGLDEEEPIQRKLNFQSGTEYLDNSQNKIDNIPFNRIQNKARALYDVAELNFKNEKPKSGVAAFNAYSPFIMGGDIEIEPISDEQLENKSYDYNNRLIEVTHETQHAIDHMEDLDISSGADYKNKVISEFRTFAVQSAVSYKLEREGKNVSMKYKDMQKSYDPDVVFSSDSSNNGFAQGNFMFNLIKFYIKYYTNANQESDEITLRFITEHQSELNRAIEIYKALKEDKEGEHDYITTTEEYEEEGDTIDYGDVQITDILTKKRKIRKNIKI